MHNILAIFRKDVRATWPQLLLWLVLLAMLTATEPAALRKGAFFNFTLPLDLLVSWVILTVAHQERLAGDTQYWLARPIPQRAIFAAKLLFVGLFVHLPLLVSGIVKLAALGFSPLEYSSTLLMSQVALATIPVFIFPLAAITRNLAQAVIALLCVVLPLYGLDQLFVAAQLTRWSMTWWRAEIGSRVLQAALSAIVVYIMYASRRVVPARAVFAAGAIFVIFRAFSLTEDPDIVETRISPDFSAVRHGPLNRLEIPVEFSGLPAAGEVVIEKLWRTAHSGRVANNFGARIDEYGNGRGVLILPGSPAKAGLLGDLTLEFTVFERLSSFSVPGSEPLLVPGIGPCVTDRFIITCLSPRPAHLLGLTGATGNASSWIVPPGDFPLSSLPFSPVDTYRGFWNTTPHDAPQYLFTARILAHARAHIDFGGLAQ